MNFRIITTNINIVYMYMVIIYSAQGFRSHFSAALRGFVQDISCDGRTHVTGKENQDKAS